MPYIAIAMSALLLGHGAPALAQAVASGTAAEAPRVYLNTASQPAPTPGHVVLRVGSGGNLQAALNKAQPGDVIELAKGASFTGNFVLPNKNTASTDWIVIRPSNYAMLPAEGERMTPTLASTLALPQVLTPNQNHAIKTEAGAHHYRLVGLNVGVVAGLAQSYGLIGIDGEQRTEAGIPHDIILDRLYIHGTPEIALRRCLTFNSASTAVVDSWVSECHDKGSDSQAIAGWNGPGPFKIVNNYLEGAGENIIFGGSDPAIKDLTPSDIEIRRNHVTKLLAWKKVWSVKNLVELKHARRVLLEGNIFENNWTHGQNGTGIVMMSANQNGQCTWCATQDVTIRYNMIRNVGSGINISNTAPNRLPSGQTRRIAIVDNVISHINVGPFDGDGRGFSTFGAVDGVLIAHNTMMTPTNSAFVFGPAGSRVMNFSAIGNLVGGGTYGMLGDNFMASKAFSNYAPNGQFRDNVMIIAYPGAVYPPGNAYPATAAVVGFFDLAGENYRLAPNSRFKRPGSDGREPGANLDSLEAMLKGVRVQP
ncbi:MAG: hypothetical protein ABI625_05060 [bacterium]